MNNGFFLNGDFIRGNCYVGVRVDSDDVIFGIIIYYDGCCICLCFFGLVDNIFMDFWWVYKINGVIIKMIWFYFSNKMYIRIGIVCC